MPATLPADFDAISRSRLGLPFSQADLRAARSSTCSPVWRPLRSETFQIRRISDRVALRDRSIACPVRTRLLRFPFSVKAGRFRASSAAAISRASAAPVSRGMPATGRTTIPDRSGRSRSGFDDFWLAAGRKGCGNGWQPATVATTAQNAGKSVSLNRTAHHHPE